MAQHQHLDLFGKIEGTDIVTRDVGSAKVLPCNYVSARDRDESMPNVMTWLPYGMEEL